MQDDWNELWPLALSMLGAALLVLAAVYRLWRQQRSVPPSHPNAGTARWFARGFAAAAALWLLYGCVVGYARFLQPPWQRQLLVHGDALWSIPLFIGAVAWAAGVGVGWVMHLLAREAAAGRTGSQR